MRLGYCGGDTRWSVESDFDAATPDEVVDAVLVVEGLNPAWSIAVNALKYGPSSSTGSSTRADGASAQVCRADVNPAAAAR